jgi:hypothetical protein
VACEDDAMLLYVAANASAAEQEATDGKAELVRYSVLK